jgi:hypothetical protein
VRYTQYIERGDVVERVLIHLDRQSSPSEFRAYGARVVPFYNYLQAAFVLYEDGRIPPESVLAVATDLVIVQNFERSTLARSYLDLCRRGHLMGARLDELSAALDRLVAVRRASAASELVAMIDGIRQADRAERSSALPEPIDYRALVNHHNPRRKRTKARR